MVQATLIACKGARRVSWEELAAMPAPPPLSRVHAPVPHADLVSAVEKSLGTAGYEVQDRQFAVQQGNNQLFATFVLASEITREAVLSVGLRSSYNLSLPLGLVAGVKTLVCSNMCFRSDLIDVRRKHTTGNVRKGVFYREVESALSKLASWKEVEAQRIAAAQAEVLTQDQAYALILRSAMQHIVPNRLLPSIAKAFDKPPHDHGNPLSLYSLGQAFTYCLGQRYDKNPVAFASQTMRLSKLLSPFGGEGASDPATPEVALAG